MDKAVSEIGLGVTEWEEVAADREQWRRLIKGYGEPACISNSSNNSNSNSNSNISPAHRG